MALEDQMMRRHTLLCVYLPKVSISMPLQDVCQWTDHANSNANVNTLVISAEKATQKMSCAEGS